MEAGVLRPIGRMDGFAINGVAALFAQVIAACIQGRIVPLSVPRNNIVAPVIRCVTVWVMLSAFWSIADTDFLTVLNSCLVLSKSLEMVVVVFSRLLTLVLMLSAFWLMLETSSFRLFTVAVVA